MLFVPNEDRHERFCRLADIAQLFFGKHAGLLYEAEPKGSFIAFLEGNPELPDDQLVKVASGRAGMQVVSSSLFSAYP